MTTQPRTLTRTEIEQEEATHFTPEVLLDLIRRLDLDLPERAAIAYAGEADDALLRPWRDRYWNHAIQARARDRTLPPPPSPSGNNRRDIEALAAWASPAAAATGRPTSDTTACDRRVPHTRRMLESRDGRN